jgi:hypothetical protein
MKRELSMSVAMTQDIVGMKSPIGMYRWINRKYWNGFWYT